MEDDTGLATGLRRIPGIVKVEVPEVYLFDDLKTCSCVFDAEGVIDGDSKVQGRKQLLYPNEAI